jgi:CDP-glucose 4,6-dehydratase
MGGHDPYSNSKGCSELVTTAYRSSFFNYLGSAKIASARAGNVIGGGDWGEDRLIPDIFKAFENKEPVMVRNPSATRPWQHVLEPLSGYLVLAERLFNHGEEFADGWNFGPRESDVKPVRNIIEYLVERWGEGASWVHDESEQPHEAQLLKLDISKAKTLLEWSPKWDLITALDSIIEWQKERLKGSDAKEITLEQIYKFEKLLGKYK